MTENILVFFFCFTLQFTVYSYIIVRPKVSWARLICHSH